MTDGWHYELLLQLSERLEVFIGWHEHDLNCLMSWLEALEIRPGRQEQPEERTEEVLDAEESQDRVEQSRMKEKLHVAEDVTSDEEELEKRKVTRRH